MAYELMFAAYCGMSYVVEEGDRAECRVAAAKLIRLRRRRGHPCTYHKLGACWEIMEPENCAMVPDTAGMLYLRHIEEPEEDESEDWEEPVCRTCGEPYDGFGDGWDGECPSCADKSFLKEEGEEEE